MGSTTTTNSATMRETTKSTATVSATTTGDEKEQEEREFLEADFVSIEDVMEREEEENETGVDRGESIGLVEKGEEEERPAIFLAITNLERIARREEGEEYEPMLITGDFEEE